MERLKEIFSELIDIRDIQGKRHCLMHILVMSVCGILCGYTDFEDIYDYCKGKEEWLDCHLGLWNGIPCSRTFNNVFRAIPAKSFLEIFMKWIKEIVGDKTGKQIIIDGKAIRGAAEKVQNGNIPYIVSAYLSEVGISIGQVKCDEKSNEITAIPELIELLDIEDCIITIDAIGCQSKIVSQIVKKKGHYCLSVKENQSNLYNDIDAYFKFALTDRTESKNILCHETREFSHGRIEKRKYYLSSDMDLINHINDRSKWKNLKTVGMVENTREIGSKTTVKQKYYILDIDITAERFAEITRNHWQIENNLHWVLDMYFREDLSRTRKDNALENLSLLTKMCFNIISLDKRYDTVNKNGNLIKLIVKRKINRYNLYLNEFEDLLFSVITLLSFFS
jgi:predicted transposase YbfD/YdcC